MRVEQKTNVKKNVNRLFFVILALVLQVAWIVFLVQAVNKYSTIISLVTSLLAFCIALRIYVGSQGKFSDAAFKMPWIIVILALPVLGLSLYFLLGYPGLTRKMQRRYARAHREVAEDVGREELPEGLEEQDSWLAGQAGYLYAYGRYSLYENTDVTFYSETTEAFEAQLAELEKAEHFIFLEYHAVEEAQAFERLKDVLARRAAAGVEVRLFYDDVGSITFLKNDFDERMEALGIHCRVFNRLMPRINVFMNNRDHRKIMVIDGRVGFTGGYNLADEYFNITHPYGYWKDTGIRLEGDAVRSMTGMFLEMWNMVERTDFDYSLYLPKYAYHAREKGFVLPYADGPLTKEPLGENIYLNLIHHAKHTLYIGTPYLIISDEMVRALGLAAKRGVDVRVVTPGIPDKKLVYQMTRSYYEVLIRSGVRIYEYTPGFLHEKQFYCDGETAIVGTINLDFRSLYHHFENAVLFTAFEAVDRVGDDFAQLFRASEEVTEKYRSPRSSFMSLGYCILRLFAPLM
ncbi:MAG: cardiolipin synthase [Lachnospiraceae bacterium]|nr:cardiolipin synthase [Lachnospiraceae bacterium]